jgi:uncharacterized phage protein gp47/JayE
MANFGLSNEGFTLKRLQDILNEQRQKAVELFQDLVQPGDVVDTSDSSALGRIIALDAAGDADLWEVAQMLYSAFDPNSATGIALDNIVAYGGISRFGESFTTAVALFAGDNGILIPSGNTVKASISNNQFTTVDSVALSPSAASGVTVTILSVTNNTAYSITYSTSSSTSNTVTYTSDADATNLEILNGLKAIIDSAHPLLSASVVGTTLVVDKADVFQTSNFSVTANLNIAKVKKIGNLQASVVGVIEQEANTINTIVTPVLGWDSVTNPLAASTGRLRETDEELRLRFRNTKLERSSNILDSLYSALNNLEGVTEVAVYENDTDVTDSNGVLPHSFLPVVLGGSSQLIAETIWENKPLGIRSQGNTEIDITDSQGFIHTIGFERPNPVTIYITMNLSVNPEDTNIFPGDGADQIKQAIIDYAASNFGVGDDIIYSRLYTPINSIPGHQVDSLFIGTSPSPAGTSNIVIPFNAIGSFESVNILVNI